MVIFLCCHAHMISDNLRLALPKGKIGTGTLKLFNDMGYPISFDNASLFYHVAELPLDIFFVRQRDIKKLLDDNYCDIAIVGVDYIAENWIPGFDRFIHLNYCHCRLSICIPNNLKFKNTFCLKSKTIATTTPNILSRFLEAAGVQASIYTLNGSIELAPMLGIADAICDIIDSGQTIRAHHLKEAIEVLKIQACLVQAKHKLSLNKQAICKNLTEQLLKKTNGFHHQSNIIAP